MGPLPKFNKERDILIKDIWEAVLVVGELAGGPPTASPKGRRFSALAVAPFLGSGATAEAAMIEGLDWAGCEIADGRDGRHDYVSLVQARVERFERGESPGQVVARPSGRAQRRGR